MEIIYRACDNKEFQFEEECLQYEEEQQLETLKDEIVGVDWDGVFVDIAEVGVENFFDTVAVVTIKTMRAVNFLNTYDICIDMEFDKPGTWIYDSDCDYFVPLDKKRKEFMEKIKQLDTFKDLLENH